MKAHAAEKDSAQQSSKTAARPAASGAPVLSAAPPAYGIGFVDEMLMERPLAPAQPAPVLQRQAAASVPPPGAGALPVSPPDDPLEKQADSIAERVMASPNLPPNSPPSSGVIGARVQRKCACGGAGECDACKQTQMLQRIASGPAPARAPAIVHDALRSSGEPLDAATRAFMEPRIGSGLAQVRIHTDSRASESAAAVNALAYTVGSHVVFGRSQYDPHTGSGQRLLAHELAHVAQQSAGNPSGQEASTAVLQRQPVQTPTAAPDTAKTDSGDSELKDEAPKYKGLHYDGETLWLNKKWFEMLSLRDANPLAPWNPYDTPNAFINRVFEWQQAVHKRQSGISFSEFVFAASDSQTKVTEASRSSIVAGLDEVLKGIQGGKFEPGMRIDADGVLGAGTLWTMVVADTLASDPDGLELTKKFGLPVDMITFMSDEGLLGPWRAAHAFLFNKPSFKVTWDTMAQAELVIDTFEALHLLSDMDQSYLMDLFFEGKPPEQPEIHTDDLMAILARGYEGEALQGIASIFEVNREYYHAVDVERLLRAKDPKWLSEMNLKMAESRPDRVKLMLSRLDLEPPSTKTAQAAFDRLQGDSASDPQKPHTSVLAVVYEFPERSAEFWHEKAKAYVEDKAALEAAAEEATQEKLAEMEKEFQKRLTGTPDIGKDDASAFLELLVGDAFMSTQNQLHAEHMKVQSSGLEINEKLQERKGGDKVNKFYDMAQEKEYLIVQLGDDAKSRFVLTARQIEQSRAAADRNGVSPLIFDLIDTPHSAMHTYIPTRFTARKTENGSEAASNPWQLEEKPDHWYENWKYFRTNQYSHFDPVLVELHQFNPDAGQLVRLWRGSLGTDKIMVQYVWTLGGSLPTLSDNLWSAQSKINIVGWIDAVLTVVALATVIAAPLGAGVEASGAEVAGGVTEAAVNQAMRRALMTALRKFVVTEAIGEILNRISYYLNASDDVPESVKTAWNGLMLALLIFGAGKLVRQGIKSYKSLGSVAFRQAVADLEREIEAQAKTGKTEMSGAEAAAEAEIEKQTAEKFRTKVAPDGGEHTGAERVRSDDPRAAGISEKAASADQLTPEDRSNLRKILGDDTAAALEKATDDTARKRLALLKDPDAISRIVEAVKPKELAKLLATVSTETLRAFAKVLDKEALQAILKAFSKKPAGIRLMKAFASDPARLAQLLAALDANSLLQLADNPGAEMFAVVAAKVDPAALAGALKYMGTSKASSITRFRNLLAAVGPDHTALVLNTYTAGEIRGYWSASGKLSPAQRVASLAIKREGVPTKNRLKSGIPVPAIDTSRPRTFDSSHFPSFYAVGPESSAPAAVRNMLTQIQNATAIAANKLENLIRRANAGVLIDSDLKEVPPEARKTVEACLDAAPDAVNRDALYGSALQYMAEAELRAANGGKLPEGLVVRRQEVQAGKTLIPDAQIQLTFNDGLRFPKKNMATGERAVFDWTTPGQAGKVEKYAGGNPPVTYGVEIIQPGPPPPPPAKPVVNPPVHPKVDVEPDTETQ